MRILLSGLLLVYSAITDIRRRQISGIALIIFGTLGVICAALGEKIVFTDTVLGVAVGIVMIVFSFFTKGELGLGDGLLLCVTGLFLGFRRNLELLFLAMFIAALYAIIIIFKNFIVKKNIKRGVVKQDFPFVPFLLISFILIYILF